MNKKESKVDITKPIGFQLGVSKTFSISPNSMWDFLLSEEGIAVWLGDIDFGEFEINKPFKAKLNVEGKLTVFKPDSHLRTIWKPKHWKKHSILEVRITNSKGRAKILFHQTKLYEIEQRTEMKNYWNDVIIKIQEKTAGNNV